MRGAIHSLPQYAFMAWCLVKHRDNFTFYLYIINIPAEEFKKFGTVTNKQFVYKSHEGINFLMSFTGVTRTSR
jgi:hypothetical protein